MSSTKYNEYLSQIPLDWQKVRIEELGSIYSGGTPSRDEPSFWDGSVAWVTPTELTALKSKWLLTTKEYITEAGLRGSSANLLPQGSLLVTTRATIGVIAIASIPVSTNQGFKSIVPNKLTDSNFYYHLLNFIAPEIVRLASGSTFDEISRKDFLSIIVPRPELSEQKIIAEILDTIDEAIARTDSLIQKLKLMKAGLLNDLLTRGLDEHGELRDPIKHPEQFKDSVLGRIPREWEVRTCESLCREIVVGIVIKPSQYYQPSGIPVLRSANVRETGLVSSDLVFMSEQSNRLLAKSMIYSGDVLTVRTGYPGTSCVVTSEFDGANCVDIIISRPSTEIDSAFLAMWINSDFGKNQVLRVQGGLAQQHFNVGELQKLLVAKPSIHEQSKIQIILNTHDTRIRTEETYLNKLKWQKRGLMHDLLTGKVRVT